MARFTYGGQALIEGVLMRGRDAIAVAFRHPDGRIVWAAEPLDTGPHGWRLAKAPLVRGLIVLYETLIVGTRWLVRSANLQASGEGVELGRGSVAILLILTLAAGIGVFFLLPLFIASVTTSAFSKDAWVQNLAEGLIRVAIFMGYLVVVSRAPDVRRVFMYHGAEHMTIHALEAGDPLTVSKVRRYPTAHPRCGTEFLVVVIILSILLFSLLGRSNLLVMVAGRLLLIPVIAAIGYELLRFGSRHRSNPIVKAVMYPGILVQLITTKRPTDDQIEVAIVSMEQALSADGERIPDGSALYERDRLDPEPAAVPA
ncbi:MAG TPA: DUF1385 domain-containing protein [Candidatus Limnocylindrales bacterium]|nr:DUF1385 domain-containing protein [Candidatus Limnocylindrales bacterium]